MTRLQLFLVSLIAAIPCGILFVLIVMMVLTASEAVFSSSAGIILALTALVAGFGGAFALPAMCLMGSSTAKKKDKTAPVSSEDSIADAEIADDEAVELADDLAAEDDSSAEAALFDDDSAAEAASDAELSSFDIDNLDEDDDTPKKKKKR